MLNVGCSSLKSGTVIVSETDATYILKRQNNGSYSVSPPDVVLDLPQIVCMSEGLYVRKYRERADVVTDAINSE